MLAFAGKEDIRGGPPPPQPTATPLHGPRSTHAMESQQHRFTIIMNKDSRVQPIVSPFPGVLKLMSFRKRSLGLEVYHKPHSHASPHPKMCAQSLHRLACVLSILSGQGPGKQQSGISTSWPGPGGPCSTGFGTLGGAGLRVKHWVWRSGDAALPIPGVKSAMREGNGRPCADSMPDPTWARGDAQTSERVRARSGPELPRFLQDQYKEQEALLSTQAAKRGA